jgi:hypothetical protein
MQALALAPRHPQPHLQTFQTRTCVGSQAIPLPSVVLRRMPALAQVGLTLMLQKNPEDESMGDQ